MSNRLSASVFRIPCNQASRDDFGDLLRGVNQPIILWKNSTAIIQGAIFIGDPNNAANLVTDLSNVTAVVLAMRAGGPSGALLFAEQTVAAAALNPALNYDAWTAGSAQHFQFLLTADQTNVAAQSNVWMVIGVNTTDAGAFPVGTNKGVQILDPGISNPGDTNPPTTYTGWSKAEADARYALTGTLASATTWTPGITSVGDGAAGSLEAVATVALTAASTMREFVLAATGEFQAWQLVAGNDATDALHQRPTDYNAATNAKIWVRRR